MEWKKKTDTQKFLDDKKEVSKYILKEIWKDTKAKMNIRDILKMAKIWYESVRRMKKQKQAGIWNDGSNWDSRPKLPIQFGT